MDGKELWREGRVMRHSYVGVHFNIDSLQEFCARSCQSDFDKKMKIRGDQGDMSPCSVCKKILNVKYRIQLNNKVAKSFIHSFMVTKEICHLAAFARKFSC